MARRKKPMAPKAVISEASPNVVRIGTRDEIVNELAATTLHILDLRDQRTEANKSFNSSIKKAEKRVRELATTCKTAGYKDDLQMNFGSIKPGAPALAEDDDQREEHDN